MTLDQRRAVFALARVQGLDRLQNRQEYRAYIRAFPATVIRAGLGQALALELSQSAGKAPGAADHKEVLNHVSAWLVAKDGWGPHSPYAANDRTSAESYADTALIRAIMAGPEAHMIRAQTEVMAFAKWLKVFAEALIPPRDADAPGAAEPGA